MPLYEFICKNKHKTEKIVKFDTSSISCTECGSESIKIVSLPSPPKFSGSGWTQKFHQIDRPRKD